MDIITYALCRKMVKSAVSGIKKITVDGLNLIIETNDGNEAIISFPAPENGKDGADGKDGISVTNIKIDENNHLICILSDGTEKDAGKILNNCDNCSNINLSLAEKSDIDNLFNNKLEFNLATKADIDNLFK